MTRRGHILTSKPITVARGLSLRLAKTEECDTLETGNRVSFTETMWTQWRCLDLHKIQDCCLEITWIWENSGLELLCIVFFPSGTWIWGQRRGDSRAKRDWFSWQYLELSSEIKSTLVYLMFSFASAILSCIFCHSSWRSSVTQGNIWHWDTGQSFKSFKLQFSKSCHHRTFGLLEL